MNVNNIKVGNSSSYSFLAPYDTILSSKTVYEVTKLSTLRSLLTGNYNPLENIYKLYGMSEAEYEEDLSINRLIVELTLGTKVFYVPINRITDVETETNVHYSERMIGIKLGFIPDTENLEVLLGEIRLLVKDMTGIEPLVSDAVISSKVSILEADHLTREDEREALKGEHGNYKKLYYDLKLVEATTSNKLKAVEKVVLNTLI